MIKLVTNKKTLLLLLLAVTFYTANAIDKIKFKNGDRVCFIGNSITHGGTYHTFLQLYNATRFPTVKVKFFNSGIAGDVADGMIRRLEKDVLSHKPNYAFLMTGMNDIQRNLYFAGEVDKETLSKRQKALDNYFVKTEKLANLLLSHNIQPVFMTPSIYDQTAKIERFNDFGANDALAVCAEHIRNMAKKYNAPLADLYAAMNTINLKGQRSDPTFTIVGADRIHPGDAGHLIMAYEIIKSIMPSKYVAKMELNARSQKVETANNCTIEIEKQSKDIKFKVLANALPFPIKQSLHETTDLISFQQELNQEMLIVNKLAKGSYKLFIDKEEIGSFTNDALKSGINLSTYAMTPQYQQAERISSLCFEYKKVQNEIRTIYFVEYRMLQHYDGPNTVAGKRAFLDEQLEKQKGKSYYNWNVKNCNRYFEALPKEQEFWKELESIREKIYSANTPQWHTFKLEKIS